jgi:flagellar protein FliL
MPLDGERKEVQEKPKSKKLLVIVCALAVLLVAGGAGAYYKFVRAPQKGADGKKQVVAPVFYGMNTFMVNLADPGAKRFLKVTIKLEVDSPDVTKECNSLDFALRDHILTLLSSKDSDEIISPEDKLALKKQIMETVNHALHKGRVLDVYFTDFLIQ